MAEENCTRPETVAGIDLAPSILVVEDDCGLNLLIQKNLIKAGYRTAGAFSGAEALGAAGGMGDVLLLLDYKLPDMTGEELIRKLGAAGAAVPFIVMTGYGDEKTAVAMMKLGALEYVIKDAGFLDLLPKMVTRAVDGLISRRKLARADERIRKLNRVYAVLSNINQAIVRIHEPATLFKEICRIAVEDGGFRMAWIGMADSATGNVNPVVSAGATGDYLEKVHIVLGDEARGNCPAGSALKAGGHFVCNDVENGPCMTSWREEAIRMGFRSSAAFPLTVSGQVRGVFTLYAAERAFFDEEELKLLDELAMDVSFAMEFTEKEAERKLAEEALRQSEARFRILFEQAADIILLMEISPKGMPVIRDVNNATLRILGFERNELIDRPVSFINVAFDASREIIDKRQTVLSGPGKVFEARHRCKDGTIRDFECSATEMQIGLKTFAISVERDITERKRAEEALWVKNWAIESTISAIATSDMEGNLNYVNPAFLKLWGYNSPAEVLGKPSVGFWQMSEKAAEILEAVRTKGGWIGELVAQSKDGSFFDVQVSSSIVMKHTGQPVCIYASFVDITDRKRAEESVRESEARYRALFETSADGILIADLETKIFEYANPAICRMLGYTENELRTMNVADIHPKDALQSVVAEFEAQARGDKILAEGLPCLSKDGTILYADINAVKIIINGKACNAGFFRDITKRKQAEENRKKLEDQLRQSQKMEAIGQLASGISHDFNNLLGGIMGHAELLKIRLGAGSGLLDHADRIISCCVKASDLTRQLLSFARKAPALVRAVDPNAIIRQVVEILKRTMDRRIEIAIDLEEQPPHISGDQSQLENALLNVAINARDAMPQGGRLSITSKTVDLDQAILPDEHFDIMEGRYIRISIADTGIGMSDEIKARIFEPFFTTKEVGKGTGLGLASVYGCIKQHGGYITVESREGEGARFDLYLPVAESAQPAAATEDAALAPGKGTLLVVDDEVVYHEVLSGIFKGLGYTVHCCIEGAEAVKFYSEHHASVDIVVLDMNMPKMNGLDCFRRLKEINAGVRVIVSSGYGHNADRTALQNEGARAFVQKPYKAAELAGKIVELMG